ncbi:Neurotransmitter-gated ion-channel transmembrane region, partial [Ostertagia ostertagi]
LATPADRIASEFNGERYVELFFRVHLKRKTLYYGLNWIIPSILISISNVLGFTMPPECGEKITLQITNLLSVTVFLGMVSEITPPTSESIPIIAVFFSLSMLLLGCSIIATLVIINVHFRSPRNSSNGEMDTINLPGMVTVVSSDVTSWKKVYAAAAKRLLRKWRRTIPKNCWEACCGDRRRTK